MPRDSFASRRRFSRTVLSRTGGLDTVDRRSEVKVASEDLDEHLDSSRGRSTEEERRISELGEAKETGEEQSLFRKSSLDKLEVTTELGDVLREYSSNNRWSSMSVRHGFVTLH